jgi:hypothetical protein
MLGPIPNGRTFVPEAKGSSLLLLMGRSSRGLFHLVQDILHPGRTGLRPAAVYRICGLRATHQVINNRLLREISFRADDLCFAAMVA